MSQNFVPAASQKRIDLLLARLSRTPQGKQAVEWMYKSGITPQFATGGQFVALYQPKNPAVPKDTDKLLLNPAANDQALFLFTADQLRRAWQTKVGRSHAPNPNPISFMLQLRFEEADARSFSTALVMEYTAATKDFSVLQLMSQQEAYKPAFQAAGMLSAMYGEDFHILRRAAFDSFFWEYKDAATAPKGTDGLTTLEAAEKGYTENFTTSLSARFAEVAKLCVDQHFQDRRDNPKENTALVIDMTFPRYDTVSLQDFMRYGHPGFGGTGTNYLTDVSGPQPLASDFYLKPTEPSLSLLKAFAERNKKIVQHLNFLGEPKRVLPAPQPAPAKK